MGERCKLLVAKLVASCFCCIYRSSWAISECLVLNEAVFSVHKHTHKAPHTLFVQSISIPSKKMFFLLRFNGISIVQLGYDLFTNDASRSPFSCACTYSMRTVHYVNCSIVGIANISAVFKVWTHTVQVFLFFSFGSFPMWITSNAYMGHILLLLFARRSKKFGNKVIEKS